MLESVLIGTKDENWYRGEENIFTIVVEIRRNHVAMLGATGAGKSTLLRNMIAWDISGDVDVTLWIPPADSSKMSSKIRGSCGTG